MIRVRDLSFSYPETTGAVADISFGVQPGERVALVGPNGSGKTTLFLLICGVLEPGTGGITCRGNPVVQGRFDPRISYLFQYPDDQLFTARVFDDVAFGPLNMGLAADEARRRAGAALETVGCAALAERPPHHLSGGERRMVAVATVLAMRPEVILFDEPTSNLDARNRRTLIRTMRRMTETLLVASHDLEFLLETCDRVIVLDEGKLIADGDIRDVLADGDLLSAHGLEKPHSLIPHSHLGAKNRSMGG